MDSAKNTNRNVFDVIRRVKVLTVPLLLVAFFLLGGWIANLKDEDGVRTAVPQPSHYSKDIDLSTYLKSPAVAYKRMKTTSTIPKTRLAPIGPHQSSINERPTEYLLNPYETLTSAKLSTFYIANPKPVYNINDVLEVIIVQRSVQNMTKHFGGDYFRAKILSDEKKASARSDGEIEDFNNGTYRAKFILRWPGSVRVEVMLVMAREGISILRRMRDTIPNRAWYLGGFSSADGKTSEETRCYTHQAPNEKIGCDFSDKRTGFPWYCIKPKSPLSCADWAWHRAQPPSVASEMINFISVKEQELLSVSNYKAKLHGLNDTIFVTDKIKNTDGSVSTWSLSANSINLPECVPGQRLATNMTSGYFYNNIWYSTFCRTRQFEKTDGMNCLRDKAILLLGDSTARQFTLLLTSWLSMAVVNNGNFKCPYTSINADINFTVKYNFHGLPLMGSPRFNLTCATQYIPNVLDDLISIPDIIFISVCTHYAVTSMKLYETRMLKIKGAIQRLLKRSPSTKVVIKSANTREFTKFVYILENNEWYIYQLDRKQREIFAHEPVILLDEWDATVAQFFPDSVHADNHVIKNLLDILLSYICQA